MKIKDKVKSILAEHPLNDNQKLDKWIEEVFVHFYQEIKEEQEEKLDQKADKIDIKLLIERSDEKFLALQKEMNTRFEAMNVRFETLQKEMNTRFEAMNVRFETLQKEMNTRFEAMQKEMNTRFEAVHKEMNARFEAVEKRFNAVQWMIGVGFTLLAIMMTLSNFIKK
jgi:DNA anti-recombination protein RmuC